LAAIKQSSSIAVPNTDLPEVIITGASLGVGLAVGRQPGQAPDGAVT
jgi:hypothetical protein